MQAYEHIPAISAGVVVGDNLVWSKGYGTLDADHKIPTAPDTIYSICSISKLFTSISLMQQYEQGKVRLDEPITTYLPWAKLKATDEDSVPDHAARYALSFRRPSARVGLPVLVGSGLPVSLPASRSTR